MALTRTQIQAAVRIVANDPEASQRIRSALNFLGRASGPTRNMLMALGYGVAELSQDALLAAAKAGGMPSPLLAAAKRNRQIPLDPNRAGSWGYELQCTEIAERAAAAIMKQKSSVPRLLEASMVSRSAGFAHAGVLLVMQDTPGATSKYVADWWATLDIENPVLFRFDDFDQNRSFSGVPLVSFVSFA